jgi:hypothetical protein
MLLLQECQLQRHGQLRACLRPELSLEAMPINWPLSPLLDASDRSGGVGVRAMPQKAGEGAAGGGNGFGGGDRAERVELLAMQCLMAVAYLILSRSLIRTPTFRLLAPRAGPISSRGGAVGGGG